MNDKDQAAIDHVASVSKNPHAAMIVKWLITGCEVKRKDSQITIDCPSWLPTIKYELIEPKPAKPAYRVYTTQGQTYTVDRNPEGEELQSIGDNCRWLSDWIEYDPPKKWPTPLVERIAAIDIKAAEWIVKHWNELLDEKYVTSNNYSRDSDELINMFHWDKSPQRHYYWNLISKQLRDQAS